MRKHFQVNTRTCGIEGSYASIGDSFYSFSMLSEIFAATVVILVSTGLVCIAAIFFFRDSWEVLLKFSMLLQFLAGGVAVALCATSATAIDAANYKDNNNVAQKVRILVAHKIFNYNDTNNDVLNRSMPTADLL